MQVSLPVGQRVEELKFRGADIDLAKEYDVVMNNYRAAGSGIIVCFRASRL